MKNSILLLGAFHFLFFTSCISANQDVISTADHPLYQQARKILKNADTEQLKNLKRWRSDGCIFYMFKLRLGKKKSSQPLILIEACRDDLDEAESDDANLYEAIIKNSKGEGYILPSDLAKKLYKIMKKKHKLHIAKINELERPLYGARIHAIKEMIEDASRSIYSISEISRKREQNSFDVASYTLHTYELQLTIERSMDAEQNPVFKVMYKHPKADPVVSICCPYAQKLWALLEQKYRALRMLSIEQIRTIIHEAKSVIIDPEKNTFIFLSNKGTDLTITMFPNSAISHEIRITIAGKEYFADSGTACVISDFIKKRYCSASL